MNHYITLVSGNSFIVFGSMTKTTYYLCVALHLLFASVGCEEKSWLVICASGVTCGGKTTITKSLQNRFNGSVLLKQDDYYLEDNDPRHVQLPALQWRNRELMSSLDMDRMKNDIEEVLCRKNSSLPLLILDGFMLYYDKYITSLCDIKFFFLLAKDACIGRRKKRNRKIPDIERYFEEYVWPAYLKYREIAFRENPDAVLIDGGASNISIVEEMTSVINQEIRIKNQRKIA